jgi:hypothetical protein
MGLEETKDRNDFAGEDQQQFNLLTDRPTNGQRETGKSDSEIVVTVASLVEAWETNESHC